MRLILLLLLTLNLLHAQKKIALLIGNSSYAKKGLSNPTNDIDLLAEKLSNSKLGFTVYKRPNLTKSQMLEELKAFYKQIDSNTIALIYFSGHGVHSTIDGKNYLIPIGGFGSLLNESQLSDVAVSDSYLLGSTSGAKFSILLLDACRSNDFAKVRGDKGLGQPQSVLKNDYIISYATDVGKTADDGYSNSPYALALSHNLLGDYPIEEMFRLVRKEVSTKTGGTQYPLYKPSFNERLCLTGVCGQKPIVPDNSQELARLRAENQALKNQQNRRVVEEVVVPTPKPIFTSKWLVPTNTVCTKNGGKLYKGVCQATWSDATKICSTSGGRLPSRSELRKVITDCGGEMKDDNSAEWKRNRNNSHYQNCYKQRGFSDNDWYWTSTNYEEDSSYAWSVLFDDGFDFWNGKTVHYYALCVR